jgi:hypothetical protein
MSIALENKLFHQFKQNDYVLFNVESAFADVLDQHKESSFYQRYKASWNNLRPAPYLVEGRIFRFRRYSVLKWQHAALQLMTPEAHFQSKQYNSVYGDINRVFAPVTPVVLQSALLRGLIQQTIMLFDAKLAATWRVHCHQFRITAS